MGAIGIFAIFLSSSLCLYFVLALIRLVHKLWWNPIRIQHQMRLQGITGPSYRFLHGSNNDVLNMKNEAKNRPMGLSHDMMPKVQPHIHSWVNKYGKQKKKKKTPSYILLNFYHFSFSYIPLSFRCREDLSSMVWHSTSTGHYRTTAYQRDTEH